MSQSRLGSFIEVCINIAIGFAVNFAANLVILPMFGLHISLADNFLLGLLYTIVSVIRGYVIRRWFNARIEAAANRIADSHR